MSGYPYSYECKKWYKIYKSLYASGVREIRPRDLVKIASVSYVSGHCIIKDMERNYFAHRTSKHNPTRKLRSLTEVAEVWEKKCRQDEKRGKNKPKKRSLPKHLRD